MSQTIPETQTISLDVGTKMLVVGANPSAISPFRKAGEDRYVFMDVGTAKLVRELPGKNFAFVIMNGRIPTEAQENIETIADRSHAGTILVVADSASIQRTMEGYPTGNKGVATFDVQNVVRRIDLHASRGGPPIPPPPPNTQQNPPPVQGQDKLDSPPPGSPTPPRPSLKDTLNLIEQFYDRFGADPKKVIAHFRELGFGESVITDGALYQRCRTIRRRRERQNERGSEVTIPPELLQSGAADELVKAIEIARDSQRRLLELAADVASENRELKLAVAQHVKELKDLPILQEEVVSLRAKALKAKELFGGN